MTPLADHVKKMPPLVGILFLFSFSFTAEGLVNEPRFLPYTSSSSSISHARPLQGRVLNASPDPRREPDTRSLAEKMFGDVSNLFNFGDNSEEKIVREQGPLDAGRAISDIDSRAASGDITYQV